MSKAENKIAGFFGTIIAWAIIVPFMLLMALPFMPFRQRFINTFQLERFSISWKPLKWFYVAIMIFMAMLVFTGVPKLLTTRGGGWPAAGWPHPVVVLLICLAAAFIFNLLFLLQQCASDPTIQMKLAGLKAETYVQKLLEKFLKESPDCRVLNGSLLVFKEGSTDEFSAELDHVLVTQRHIYVIETKYKSGTISANADSPTWNVSSSDREGSMRNALIQAKKSIALLRRELDISEPVIPLVAIYGKNVKVVDGPSNVVVADNLLSAIQAFETLPQRDFLLSPTAIEAKFLARTTADPSAKERHIARANVAKAHHESAGFVQAASI